MGLVYTPVSFIFNKRCSDDFNISIVFFEAPDFTVNGLTREIQKGEINLRRKRANHYGAIPSDTIKFTLGIVPVLKTGKLGWTREQSTSINKWLQESDLPQLLHFNDNKPDFINYYAVCTEIKDEIINDINGKTITFVTDSPYGYTSSYKKTFTCVNELTFKYNSLSDDDIYYPTITISDVESRNILIKNMTDNGNVLSLSFEEDFYPNLIKISGQNEMITDENGNLIPFYKLGLGIDGNPLYWFKLLSGFNEIKIAGKCKVTIESSFPKKAGCL